MTKNEILCEYLQSIFSSYKVKAEYSTNFNDQKVIIVQEQIGEKIIFFGEVAPLFNYFEIIIYGEDIRGQKETASQIGELIGQNIIYTKNGNKYQILVKQLQNPQAIEYMDIRRVGYQMILKTIISKIN